MSFLEHKGELTLHLQVSQKTYLSNIEQIAVQGLWSWACFSVLASQMAAGTMQAIG